MVCIGCDALVLSWIVYWLHTGAFLPIIPLKIYIVVFLVIFLIFRKDLL